jgi:hypothetical protein
MIERRCLIRGHGSTGSFPGDFAELENGFVSPSAGVGLPDRPHFAESDFSWALKFHPLRVETSFGQKRLTWTELVDGPE